MRRWMDLKSLTVAVRLVATSSAAGLALTTGRAATGGGFVLLVMPA